MLEIKQKIRSGLGSKPKQLALQAHLVHRSRQVANIAPVRIAPIRANALAGALAGYGGRWKRSRGVGGSGTVLSCVSDVPADGAVERAGDRADEDAGIRQLQEGKDERVCGDPVHEMNSGDSLHDVGRLCRIVGGER